MKANPASGKRSITLRYDIVSILSEANRLVSRQKKLRRLPHIFTRVLELPFRSDADVSVTETSDHLRFAVTTGDAGDDVRTQTIQLQPGVTKVVIRGRNFLDLSLDGVGVGVDLDLWRFRLPASTLPEMASAAYSDGELVVTVPKSGDDEEEGGLEGSGPLILVQ